MTDTCHYCHGTELEPSECHVCHGKGEDFIDAETEVIGLLAGESE